jgi:predicted RND superfamily exporter protein
MRDYSQRFAVFVLRWRFVFILLSAVLTLYFLFSLRNLSIQTSLGDLTPQKHAYMEVQKELMYIFGGLNQVSIGLVVKDGDIFNKDTLDKVVRITKKLYLLDGVNPGRVVSLSARKVKNSRAYEDGFEVKRLMRNPPETPAAMEVLKENVIRNPMYYGSLVSKDLKATQIMVDFEQEVTSRRIFRELQEIIASERDSNTDIHIAGRPILEGWMDYYLPKMGWIFVATGLIMIFLLYLAFRSKRGIILPFLSASMATIWGLGATTLMGFHMDPATILAPFFILSLGISHAVQFIKRYYEAIKDHPLDRKLASQETLAHLFIPALVSLVTDGIGFISLFIVPLAAIKSMALASGIGVLSIFFTTVTFIPPVLSYLPKPKRLEVEREERPNILDFLLIRIASLIHRPALRWTTFGVFILLATVGMIGASQLVVGDNEPGSATLYPDSPCNRADKIINDKFSGTNPYFVMVAGEDEEALISSEVLKEMESLQNYLLENVPEAGYALSLADYIKGLNMVMFGGNPAYFTIPENNGTIAEYLFLYSISGFPGDFDPVVSPNFQYANIKVDFKDHKADTIMKTLYYTKEWIDKFHKVEGVDFLFAGGVMGTLGAVNEIIEETLPVSILQVGLLVFICVALAYGSAVGGLLLLVPLLFNVLFVFGIMGLSGISLTIETLPVAALSIGRGVDYSIYVATRIREELQSNPDKTLDEATLRALVTSGKAVFFTGVTIAIGALTWVFSDIRLQARLGLTLGSLTLLNMAGALILLPLFLRIFNPSFIYRNRGMKNSVTKKDLLEKGRLEMEGSGNVVETCKEHQVSL